MSTSKFETSEDLRFQPVAGLIGAEVTGVRASADLHPTLVKALREGLCRYKVLFLRDQSHLDDAEHEDFARLFGQILNHPTVPIAQGTRHITELNSRRNERANFWHTDMTFMDAPPFASFLRAVTVPEVGGDTMWANCAAAYDALPPDLRTLADRTKVVHSNLREDTDYAADATARMNPFTSTIYETEHPLVHVHPETGERCIALGNYGHKFVGYSGMQSQHLFRIFQDAVIKSENIVRWRWRAGDLAIWDNRATQHYALADYGDQTRVMRRVTLVGEPLVGVSGERSRILAKWPNPLQ